MGDVLFHARDKTALPHFRAGSKVAARPPMFFITFLFEFGRRAFHGLIMSESVIPDDARQFLLKNIDSVAQWEGVLLLRADPGKAWDAVEAARHLYISEVETGDVMARLAARGIVAAEGTTYRYAPSSPELAAMIDRLADLYGRYLIAVTHIIHSRPKSRVQEFANAFRIRKD